MQKSKIDEPGTVVANRGYQGFQYDILGKVGKWDS
jgi:hypothetical protein